jgi:peroxiredoxin Q/BCP
VEGRALRDRASEYAEADCVVLGASFDTPAENKAFADEQGFAYQLLSDVDRSVGTAYEVVRPAGDQYETFPMRVSYLIDPEGVIRRAYAVSDVAGHADAVLADLAALRGT